MKHIMSYSIMRKLTIMMLSLLTIHSMVVGKSILRFVDDLDFIWFLFNF